MLLPLDTIPGDLSAHASQTMLFITYTPRKDAAERGYDEWLREFDNPFFNSVPGISEYSNWKVTSSRHGEPGFTYFDLLYLDSPDAYEEVFVHNAALRDFAQHWVELWATDPDAGHTPDNFEVVLSRCVTPPDHGGNLARDCRLVLRADGEAAELAARDARIQAEYESLLAGGGGAVSGYANWQLLEPKSVQVELHDLRHTRLDLLYGNQGGGVVDTELNGLTSAHTEKSRASLVVCDGTLVAAPWLRNG